MFQVCNEFGPVEDFDDRAEAQFFLERCQKDDPQGLYWILHVYNVSDSPEWPKG
jgi:hypothetical protein